MKTVPRAGPALLVVGATLAIACSDNATAPAVTKKVPTGIAAQRKVDLTKRPELTAIITTVVRSRDKSGKLVLRSKGSRRVTATWVGGQARVNKSSNVSSGNVRGVFASMVDDGSASFAQYAGDSRYTNDPASMTPVLALASGSGGHNYADTTVDSNGNVLEFYGWSPYGAPAPITDAWAYRNGQLLAQYHASWAPVSGGYVLADQIVGSYVNGSLAGSIESYTGGGGGGSGGDCNVNPNGCVMMTNDGASLGDRVAAPFLLALNKVGCWLGPNVAYASVSCGVEAAWFGIHSFTVYESTVTGAAFVEGGWYLVEWGVWTRSLYEMLACFDSKGNQISGPRGANKCQVNPRLCTGGGGSSW